MIGSGGAGKSTFSRRLAARTGLPLVHLDALFWKPGWVESGDAEWDAKVAELIARDAWIMDGNYGRTLALRLAAADTVVFLDMPRLQNLWRVYRRALRHRGRARDDMNPGCPEHLPDREFLSWIWNYPHKQRPAILAKLDGIKDRARVVILRSDAEVEAFLASV